MGRRRGETADDRGASPPSFLGRPRDRDVRRVDADPEARAVELDETVCSQGSHIRARDAGQDQRGQREHGRGIGRLDGQTRDSERVHQIVDQLVVGIWLGHDRDVRVRPVVTQAPDLPRDSDGRQEEHEPGEDRGEQVATQDLDAGAEAAWPLAVGWDKVAREPHTDGNDHQTDQERETHQRPVDEGWMWREIQHDVRESRCERANQQDQPDERARQHRYDEDLVGAADAAEHESARPPERCREERAGQPADHADGRDKQRHVLLHRGRRASPRWRTKRQDILPPLPFRFGEGVSGSPLPCGG